MLFVPVGSHGNCIEITGSEGIFESALLGQELAPHWQCFGLTGSLVNISRKKLALCFIVP